MKGALRPLRIPCARETMQSIRESVHPLGGPNKAARAVGRVAVARPATAALHAEEIRELSLARLLRERRRILKSHRDLSFRKVRIAATMERSGIVKSAKPFRLGVAGLLLITFAAVRLGLQPGATSVLYLIAVVFVSLRAGFTAGAKEDSCLTGFDRIAEFG